MKEIKDHLRNIVKQQKKLNLKVEQSFSNSENEYFAYYGMNMPGAKHYFGFLRSERYKLAAHVYIPPEHEKTVLLVHGYLEHSCYFRHFIKALIEEKYAVVAFDLPGHGLSSGLPASIPSFSAYSKAVKHFMAFAKSKLGKEVHVTGHSMGCAAIISVLLERRNEDLGKAALVGPLVHPNLWVLTNIAYNVLVPVAKKVPRAFPPTSSDKDFMKFSMTQDPMLHKEMPLQWVNAMLKWNKHLNDYGISATKIKIIQGTKDEIVDWRYNMKFLSDKFPRAEIVFIPNAFHQLFNEQIQYRNKCIKEIIKYFKQK